MNALLLFLLDRPGLLAGGLPILLLAGLYAGCAFRAARETARLKKELIELAELAHTKGVWPPPPKDGHEWA